VGACLSGEYVVCIIMSFVFGMCVYVCIVSMLSPCVMCCETASVCKSVFYACFVSICVCLLCF